jgi:hypothetical protein
MAINNWFEQPGNYIDIIKHLGISQARYLSWITSIKKVFPESWIEKKVEEYESKRFFKTYGFHIELLPGIFRSLLYNPIPVILGGVGVGGGYWALSNVIHLGQLIQAVKDESGAGNKFRDLRGGPSKYISTLFELEVLATFKACGFSLKKPMETDGLDFTFEKDNKEIHIEATHRGVSWIIYLWEKISHKLLLRGVFREHSNFSISVTLNYSLLKDLHDNYPDALEGVVDEIIENIVKLKNSRLDGFEDPKGNYSISVEYSTKRELDIQWHDPTDLAYESKQLLEGRLTDKRKLRQLLRNPGSYCAVDMRSLMPPVFAKNNGNTNYESCSRFLKGWLSCAGQFFKDNPEVGGIFIWICHFGRIRDDILDNMNLDEIILINAPNHLSDEESSKLFPFATLPQNLVWYRR